MARRRSARRPGPVRQPFGSSSEGAGTEVGRDAFCTASLVLVRRRLDRPRPPVAAAAPGGSPGSGPGSATMRDRVRDGLARCRPHCTTRAPRPAARCTNSRGAALGQRIFDVAIQGTIVLRAFDVVREAGAPYRGIVKEFKGIKVTDDLIVDLTPADHAPLAEPILCGIEVVVE